MANQKTGGQIQSISETTEWMEFVPSQLVSLDRVVYREKLRRVQETMISGTNKEKGDSLEELAELLLGSIKAFNVGAKTRTRTGEIDRYVTVKRIPGTLFQLWSQYVPVECKNWDKPVGSNVISHIHSRAKNMRSFWAILFSSKGVTGDKDADGWGQIRNWFSQDGCITIVITLEDLQRIADGDCPLRLIEERQEYVHLMA